MGLFNQILNAIDNPEQQASNTQLKSIFTTVQQLSNNYQANPAAVNSAISVIGNYARTALQEKRSTEGEQQVQQIVNQFSGTQTNNQAVEMLFSAPQIQQIVKEIEQKTGMNSDTIEAMLPNLVPLVLNLLKTGNNSQGSSNSVLSSFLDADGDGDVDLADAMQMANQYLNK